MLCNRVCGSGHPSSLKRSALVEKDRYALVLARSAFSSVRCVSSEYPMTLDGFSGLWCRATLVVHKYMGYPDGIRRITKKVGMSPCDTDAKQTLHEYVDQAGWSMRNGRHLDTSLIESIRRARGSSRISGNSPICVATLGRLGKRLPARSGNIPEHWPIPVSGVRLTRGAPSRRRAAHAWIFL